MVNLKVNSSQILSFDDKRLSTSDLEFISFTASAYSENIHQVNKYSPTNPNSARGAPSIVQRSNFKSDSVGAPLADARAAVQATPPFGQMNNKIL